MVEMIEKMYRGESDDSLFDELDIELIRKNQTEMAGIKEKLGKYLDRYKKTSDDRALALMCALAIENELDELLRAWIPTYKILIEEKGFDFSSKINLAKASKLIPGKILNAIEPVKRIRNIFAHNLDATTFEGVKTIDSDAPARNQAFPMMHNKIKTFIPNWKEENERLVFFELTVLIVLGLNIYAKHIKELNGYVRNKKNLKLIVYEIKKN